MREYIHLRSLNSVSFFFCFFFRPLKVLLLLPKAAQQQMTLSPLFLTFFFYFLLQLKDRGAATRLSISKRRERVGWRIDNRRFLLLFLGREEDSPEIDTFISVLSVCRRQGHEEVVQENSSSPFLIFLSAGQHERDRFTTRRKKKAKEFYKAAVNIRWLKTGQPTECAKKGRGKKREKEGRQFSSISLFPFSRYTRMY